MKKIFILILSIFLASCSSLSKIEGGTTLIDIKGMKLVKAKINGHKVLLILDTGALTTTLDFQSTKGLDLKLNNSTDSVHGIGGYRHIQNTKPFNLQILNKTIKYRANIIDMSDIIERFKDVHRTIHGVLGADFLKSNKCIIDYRQNKLICNGNN